MVVFANTTGEAGFSANSSFAATGLKSVAAIWICTGSSKSVPIFPAAAVKSTVPENRSDLPDTSAKPPLPPNAPPLAEMEPPKRVTSSDQTITVPPSPTVVASAKIEAPVPTKVLLAFTTEASFP